MLIRVIYRHGIAKKLSLQKEYIIKIESVRYIKLVTGWENTLGENKTIVSQTLFKSWLT